GEGFKVRRATAGMDLSLADPFLMLDHMGAVEYAPGEAKGAPDHPHRGFETVTYMMDGKIRHRDSYGGGGIITDGATQWMTAGAGLRTRWRPEFNALAYVLSGRGGVGAERRPIHEGQLAVFGAGAAIELGSDATQDEKDRAGLEVLLLGGLPIREQVSWYGPFVMNSKEEIIEAIEDYQAGRMGSIPPELSRN